MASDKWIEDAFQNAEPKIGGMDAAQFSDMITGKFKEDFPLTMTAFEQAYGPEKAVRIAATMLVDKGLTIALCRCFFASGYRMRIEDEKEGGPDNA